MYCASKEYWTHEIVRDENICIKKRQKKYEIIWHFHIFFVLLRKLRNVRNVRKVRFLKFALFAEIAEIAIADTHHTGKDSGTSHTSISGRGKV